MKKIFLSIFSCLCCQLVAAQPGQPSDITYLLPQYPFQYDASVPLPADYLGYEIGSQHVTWREAVGYMECLEQHSGRVSIRRYGNTYQNRPLIQVIVTSAENQQQIETIRLQHLALSDPSHSEGLDTEAMPVVVSLNYSIHGNEASGINASLAVAYFLAAATGPEMDQLLSQAVVLIDPGLNPDGIDKFATWVNAMRSFNNVTDPNSYEFTTPWPSGRSNHYWFDLNRDWLPVQHPEGQTVIDMFFDWRPNVLNDHHEQGGDRNFFFQPGVPEKKHALIPEKNQELTRRISFYHAQELNKIGSLYYSKEGYDDFYLGKGAAYPDIHGSVAMLFEQANSRGHERETSNGRVSLLKGARNQATASYSSIRAAVEMRKELLDYQREFYKNAAGQARRSTIGGYLVTADDRGSLYHFLQLITRHRIRYEKLEQSHTAGGLHFPAGHSYYIPTDQPEYTMVRTLMEPTPQYGDSTFYDISAWNMPPAFNLQSLPVTGTATLTSRPEKTPDLPQGHIEGGKSNYAYLIENTQYYSYRVLRDLLQAGIAVKVSSHTFKTQTNTEEPGFGYGTLLVPVHGQPLDADALYKLLEQSVKENGVRSVSLKTGLLPDIDLGSPRFRNVQKPVVAVLIGQGMSSTAAGEMWHMLDRRYRMPPTLIDQKTFAGADLSRYNVIVLPDGVPADLSKAASEKLKGWIRNGGVLVATGRAHKWITENGLATIGLKSVKQQDTTTIYRSYAELAGASAGRTVPGSIFRCRIDPSHPLAWGYRQTELPVFYQGREFFMPPKNRYATPVSYLNDPLMAGYISRENLRLMAESPYLMAGTAGKGKIIVFQGNPNFRGYWYGTGRLFMNALFFGHLISGVTLD